MVGFTPAPDHRPLVDADELNPDGSPATTSASGWRPTTWRAQSSSIALPVDLQCLDGNAALIIAPPPASRWAEAVAEPAGRGGRAMSRRIASRSRRLHVWSLRGCPWYIEAAQGPHGESAGGRRTHAPNWLPARGCTVLACTVCTAASRTGWQMDRCRLRRPAGPHRPSPPEVAVVDL